MRKTFFEQLYKEMHHNKNIYLLTGGLGYGGINLIQLNFNDRLINCEASEMAMTTIACGLALDGKIPFVYSISPFLLRRCYEVLKIYIDYENIPVKLIGSGRDREYSVDNVSHHAEDAKYILNGMLEIKQFWPRTKEEIPKLLKQIINNKKPSFLSLSR